MKLTEQAARMLDAAQSGTLLAGVAGDGEMATRLAEVRAAIAEAENAPGCDPAALALLREGAERIEQRMASRARQQQADRQARRQAEQQAETAAERAARDERDRLARMRRNDEAQDAARALQAARRGPRPVGGSRGALDMLMGRL